MGGTGIRFRELDRLQARTTLVEGLRPASSRYFPRKYYAWAKLQFRVFADYLFLLEGKSRKLGHAKSPRNKDYARIEVLRAALLLLMVKRCSNLAIIK